MLVAGLVLGTGHAAAVNALPCAGVSPTEIIAGTTPILFVHGINESPTTWTEGNVNGEGSPLQYIQDSLGSTRVTGYTFDWSKASGVAPGSHVMWVTDPLSPPSPTSVGAALAQAIGCIAGKAGHKVIIIAHSMGGLIAQDASSLDPADIAAVFTLGTPYQGSWLASAAVGQDPDPVLDLLVQAIGDACTLATLEVGPFPYIGLPPVDSLLCGGVNRLTSEGDDPGVEAMRLNGGPNGGWKNLPAWPAGLPVYPLAGSIQGTWQPLSPLPIQLPLTGSGDIVVSTSSQLAPGGGPPPLSCPLRLGLGDVSLLDALAAVPCLHMFEPDSKALLDDIITQAGSMLPTAVVPSPISGSTAPSAPAATGHYYPMPRNVQLPNGGTSYTTTIVYDQVSSSGFLVEWQAVDIGSGTFTIECSEPGRQVVPSDTHMFIYHNGAEVTADGYQSTCSNDPSFKAILEPGQSADFYIKFRDVPAVGDVIVISQFGDFTVTFNPYGAPAPPP
jgi:pimeloyl-ACP methyl ester carboxylesterase